LWLGDLAATSALEPVAHRLLPLHMAHAGFTIWAWCLDFVALHGMVCSVNNLSTTGRLRASSKEGSEGYLWSPRCSLACFGFVRWGSLRVPQKVHKAQAPAAVTVHSSTMEEELQFISFLDNSSEDLS
jgi:hypothetical protein